MEIVRGVECEHEQLAALAQELLSAFGYAYPNWTIFEAMQELTNNVGLPTSRIARDASHVIGCASLLSNDDVDGYPSAQWWLGNVWVSPSARSRGVGAQLVGAIVAEARQQNAPSLHLVTDDACAWYERQGWREIGSTQLHGNPFTVMRLDLTS